MNELDDATIQHIGMMVKNGFTSGEIVMDGKAGWWELKIETWRAKSND